MSLEKIRYRVLVVSSIDAFNKIMKEMLPSSSYSYVKFSDSISAAKRNILERDYDFIIINSPLPDDIGTRFAIDCCKSKQVTVLFLARPDVYNETYDLIVSHGVYILSKPVSKTSMAQALSALASGRERLRRMEKKTLSLEERMEEIRLVNRAKWQLISQSNMTEAEAHHFIEKKAMDNSITKAEAAHSILMHAN